MAGLNHLLPPPQLGQLLVSFDALKDNIEDWSIRETFYFPVTARDTSRYPVLAVLFFKFFNRSHALYLPFPILIFYVIDCMRIDNPMAWYMK